MALILADDTVERFEQLTRFDLLGFVERWSDFVDNDYQKIVDFFKGDVPVLNNEAAKGLDRIEDEYNRLSDIITNIDIEFDRSDFWNLVNFIDEIGGRISVTREISKFLRSTRYPGFEEDNLSIEYQVTDFDTPESIAAKDRENPNDEWADIYIKNNLLETGYNAEEGGYNLRLGKQQLNNVFLESVIDNLIDDRLYGIDIDKEFLFVNDDIKVLTPVETLRQSILVLAKIIKGEIPEFPDLGISSDLQIGSNLGAISLPFITRELRDTFSTDDTLLNFEITDIETKDTAIFVNFEVESFFNFTLQDSFQI